MARTPQTKLYYQWNAMKRRARNRTDCKVYPAWQNNFMAFKDWAEKSGYVEGTTHFCRIGDTGNYYPDNIRFGTNQSNIEEAKAKHYKFISPDGKEVSVYNLRKFCRDNSLRAGNMCSLHLGNLKTCAGWRKF